MASKPTNLQATLDMLQKPADVGSISPIGINDKFTPELSRDPVLRKLQKFFRIAKNEVNNPINYLAGAGAIGKVDKARKVAGIGHNQGPPMFDKGIASVMSDDAARKIFTVDEEMDVLYDLNQRKRRLDNKYLMDNNLTDQQKELLYKEEEALNKAISKVQEKAQEKIKKRFATNVQGRTIPELDPKLQDRMGMEAIVDAAVGDKNKNILSNVSSHIDSPGFDKFYQQSYGTTKFSTQLNKIFKNSEKAIDDPEYLSEYTRLMTSEPQQKVGKEGIASLNPLEMYEKSISPTTTMSIGSGTKPFFVNPQKLADKLDKSGAGEDFFKLRTNEIGYLDNLEYSIMKQGYKPSPIQIEIYPSGNTAISEGNHRLYRALSRGDKEVPVAFYYTGGAERLNTPFGINQLDSFLAEGEKGYKTGKEFAKYIKDVEKNYRVKKEAGGEIQSLMDEIGIQPIGETSSFKMAMAVLSPEQKLKKIKLLKKYFDKMRQAESLQKPGAALGDLSDAKKLKQGIPYSSSKSIQKELDQLQGAEKLDLNLLAKLRKEFNI